MSYRPAEINVCLVATGHLLANPRLVKEADALSKAGYATRVVACKFLPWADRADAEFVDRPWGVEWVRCGAMAPRLVDTWGRLRCRIAVWLVIRTAQHDVGLALERPHTQNRRVCVWGKIFPYLLAGTPCADTDAEGQHRAGEKAPGAIRLVPAGPATGFAAAVRALLPGGVYADACAAAKQAAVNHAKWGLCASAVFADRAGGAPSRSQVR